MTECKVCSKALSKPKTSKNHLCMSCFNKSKIGRSSNFYGTSYCSLHRWARRFVPNKGICSHCKNPKKLEMANVSQNYLRELSDWLWLCRKCHMVQDGRVGGTQKREGGSPLLVKERLNRAKYYRRK